ncbi:unnamed protein product [Rodentolepis nana]|uniref:UPF0506 domain-containing protein n=1 Tax=Rodentolepis nana TaxID=102285 RepID=A0A0R3TF03_RODNA|nr:unnamed protein product [Rodentolepis nana]
MFAFNSILFACFFALVNSQSDCKGFGQNCDRTVFNRCCGDLQCELSSPFHGVCTFCLSPGQMCLRDTDCCSGNCRWFKACA